MVVAEALAEAAFDFAFGLDVPLVQHVGAGREAEHVLGVRAFLLTMRFVVGGGLCPMCVGGGLSP